MSENPDWYKNNAEWQQSHEKVCECNVTVLFESTFYHSRWDKWGHGNHTQQYFPLCMYNVSISVYIQYVGVYSGIS